MALGADALVLCAGTLAGCGFRERVEAAAAAGFSGLSLFLGDLEAARAEGLDDSEVRALLVDRGLEVSELEPLLRWIPEAEALAGADPGSAALFGPGEADFFAAAEAVGATGLTAACATQRPVGRERILEAFAGLCRRAARHGLAVRLEFLPWSEVPDLASATAIVEASGQPNAGVTLDSWHYFRGGGAAEALAPESAARIGAIQLSDAPLQPEADLIDETLHRRRLPGEGGLDLVGLLRALRRAGVRAPLGIEVFSDRLAALSPREAARRAGQALRELRLQAEQD